MNALLLALVALTAAAPERVLVLDLVAEPSEARDAQILSGAIAEAADDHAVVVTSTDLRAMSDLAADRQTCGIDSTECLAELAGAVDVQRVVHGRLSKVDDGLLVQLSVFDAHAATGGRVSWSGASLQELIDQAPAHTAELLDGEPAGLSPVWGGVVVGAGAVVAAGTAIAAAVFNQTLLDPTTSRAQKDQASFTGVVVVVAGSVAAVGLLAGGAALLAVSE